MKFSFFPTPEIHFGCDKLMELPSLVNRYGKNALIITGSSSFQSSSAYQKLLSLFKEEEISSSIEPLTGEPSTDFVDLITRKYREAKIRCVVSIGGGSPIDAGKAISAMLSVEGSVQDYLEGVGTQQHPGSKVPFIAVSTSSGTGSEATFNAVISRVGPNGYKKSLRFSNLMPNIALVDPNLTMSCPPSVTASSGMDAFTQLIEAYVSTTATPFTDALALDALKFFPVALERAFSDGRNQESREQMAYASLVSGIALANAGLGTVHGLASPVGGFFHIPHGVVCGTLLPPVTKITIRKLLANNDNPSAIQKYASIGRSFASVNSRNEEYYCNLLVENLYEMVERLEVPRLGVYGITRNDFDKIIAETSNKSNPAKLSAEELWTVLDERI